MGNFQDIEQNLTEKYDYITLIGVFEYSEGYIGGKDPYVNMLKKISTHLKPGGRHRHCHREPAGAEILGRLPGGSRGRVFEGLEGYSHTSGVKTFSRGELEKVIRAAGDFQMDFYYPYPDYKFPMTIYSDRRLPGVGELNSNMCNYDRNRLQVFDETKVYDTLAQNQLFPQFSNSFLVILTVPGEKQDTGKTIYTKYSNERAMQLAIRTDIVEKPDGQRFVQKAHAGRKDGIISRPYPGAADCWRSSDAGSDIHINRCKVSENGVELEYLTGITLEEQMDDLLREKTV